ncbi:S-layer homology domain-containing protein [Cohnella cholangitidis]|nr:S-layer homology domain-containing protein [Cohnella cholangitidis]
MKKQFRRWAIAALSMLIVLSGFPFASPQKAAAASVATDPDKSYVSFKYDTFDPNHSLKDLLQYTSNVNSVPLGWITDTIDNKPKLRLAGEVGTSGGSAFNKRRVSLAEDRSFSTYFSLQMRNQVPAGGCCGKRADGIVFVVQTASNEAGSTGGGLGYDGVGRSIGVEYDTHMNGSGDKEDPVAIGGNAGGSESSHVAFDLNGSVTHLAPNSQANKDRRNIVLANFMKSDMDLANGVFHSWIDYDGITDTLRVYMIKEGTGAALGKYLVPAMSSGANEKVQSSTVTIDAFPAVNAAGKLQSTKTSDSSTFILDPILEIPNVDLSSVLTQDEAFVGFTASTGGAWQNHDIWKWYFNNDSGLISPDNGGSNIEQAPTKIEILNKQSFTYATDYQGNTHNGIKVNEAKASVTAQVSTESNDPVSGYPVTFSLYLVKGIEQVSIGQGRTVATEVRKDDPDILMQNSIYSRVKKTYQHGNGETQEIWEITVPTDANGQASIDLFNLGLPHLTNVKARIGGELDNYNAPHGGGWFDEAPVLFGTQAPVVTRSEVSDDRRKVTAEFDIPVKYDPANPGGFWLEIPGQDPLPLVIDDYVKAGGVDDPFRLLLKLDPTKVPPNTIIPPNVVPILHYDGDPDDPDSTLTGSVTDRSGEATLKNFPVENGAPVEVINRFAPKSQVVVNDENRDTVRVKFPNPLVTPDPDAKAAFKVKIEHGGVAEIVDVSALSLNGSDTLDLAIDPSGLDPAWGGKIPAGAVVSLLYDATQLPSGVDGIQRVSTGSGDELDNFTHPVVNLIEPTHAYVVNDETRNKVVVKLPMAVKEPAADAANAFTVVLNGTAVNVNELIWNAQQPDMFVLVLKAADLPDGKVPFENGGNPVLTLAYNPGQTSSPLVDLYDEQLRLLGTTVATGDYPITNQVVFEPISAKVHDDIRNEVIVTFPGSVSVLGDPQLQIVVNGDTSNPINVTGISGSGTNTLKLTLEDKVGYNDTIQLIYVPANGDSIVDTGNPIGSVLRPLGPTTGHGNLDYPVENQLGPNRAVVIEDGSGRNKVELSFPASLLDPQSAIPSNFNVVITPDLGNPATSVTAAVYQLGWDAVTPGKLMLNLDPGVLAGLGFPNGIPPEADVRLNYTPTIPGAVSDGTKDLGKLTLFPVENGDYERANLQLSATPDAIVGDGLSSSLLKATITKQDGSPVSNTKVVFSIPSGKPGYFIDPDTNLHVTTIEVTTDNAGKAQIPYYSEKIIGTDSVDITITAKVRDHVLKLQAEDDVKVTFRPATVSGVVVFDGNKITGATVKITDPDTLWTETVTTGGDGSYLFTVPEGGKQYRIEVTIPPQAGGSTVPVTFTQTVNVGAVSGAGSQNFPSTQTVSGLIGLQLPGGAPTKWFGNSTVSNLVVKLKDSSGHYLPNPSAGNDEFLLQGTGTGVFTANNVLPNENYQLEVWYKMEVYDKNGPTGVFKEILINGKPDPSDATKVKYPVIRITESGELNIVQDLVDPYGTVMNGSNGNAPIPGSKVTLYYWDTGLPVYLPPIAGFAPNDNASPTQYTDASGNYAYMVYPNTDYKIVVESNGFPVYTSNKISVGTAIVRHDVILYAASSSGSGGGIAPGTPTAPIKEQPTTGKPNLAVNLTTSSNVVEEKSIATITVDYLNDGTAILESGEIKVTIPDGAEVVDAGGGKVSGNTITWQVKDLAIGQKGSYPVKLKFPAAGSAEKIVDVKVQGYNKDGELANPDSAKASMKLMMFSNRYGVVEHIRYILGHPDGEFKTKNTLSRAELAAIIARLTNGGHTTEKAQYSDVPSKHWASGYIRIVTDNGIFTGFNDGTFRPNAPITREELAVVMARFLKLDGSNPINAHFADVKGRWSAAAIEALYRNGMVKGYQDGSFKPGNSIIRSEAVTLINKMLFRGPLVNVEPTFPDVSKSHWAFGQVEEASHSHKAIRNRDGSESFVKTVEDTVK